MKLSTMLLLYLAFLAVMLAPVIAEGIKWGVSTALTEGRPR